MPHGDALSEALSGISSAIEIAKLLRSDDAVMHIGEMELKYAEYLGLLIATKVVLSEVRTELNIRDDEIRRLQSLMNQRESMIRYGAAYYTADEDRRPVGEPYCTHCWDSDRLAIPLKRHPKLRGKSICPNCDKEYDRQRPLPPTQKSFRGSDRVPERISTDSTRSSRAVPRTDRSPDSGGAPRR